MSQGALFIGGIGTALPDRVVTNLDLANEFPDWNMERVAARTGVRERRIAGGDETALDLGVAAAKRLLETEAVAGSELDALVFCTQTPDYLLPPNSTLAQSALGLAEDIAALDITHACSGFMYGLSVCSGFLSKNRASNALLINGDTYSKMIRPDDRSTRTVFGDGAAATLVSNRPSPGALQILDVAHGTSGAEADRFIVREGGFRDRHPREPRIEMDGLGMLNFVLERVPGQVEGLLERNDLRKDDIDLWIFHQASSVALSSLTRHMELAEDKVVIDMSDIGNLVSASIPMAIERGRANAQIVPGMRIVLAGFGVGLSWASALAIVAT